LTSDTIRSLAGPSDLTGITSAAPPPTDETANLPVWVQRIIAKIEDSGGTNINGTVGVIRSLNWTEPPPPRIDMGNASKLINDSHYGMEDVKERILDYLAALAWATRATATPPVPQALCLIGPPGVGKTSIARALAAATSRHLEILSLGGVDDIFLIGCDRAYMSSRPGEIVRRLAQSQHHPSQVLFLLDEIDKIAGPGSSSHRSPYPPLLALLDPEQRQAWRDHHLSELPIDLSRTLFVATANDVDDIPLPLRNRMELITLQDYSPADKLIIARDYLLPRLFNSHHLCGQIEIPEGTLAAVLWQERYTPGMRTIQQAIGVLVRRGLRRHLATEQTVTIDAELALSWLRSPAAGPSIGFRA